MNKKTFDVTGLFGVVMTILKDYDNECYNRVNEKLKELNNAGEDAGFDIYEYFQTEESLMVAASIVLASDPAVLQIK